MRQVDRLHKRHSLSIVRVLFSRVRLQEQGVASDVTVLSELDMLYILPVLNACLSESWRARDALLHVQDGTLKSILDTALL